MNHNTNVLIDGNSNIQEIVRLVGSFLGISFEINHDYEESIIYRAKYKNEIIQAYDDHGFEDDCGIHFSKYDFIITCDSIVNDPNELKVTETRQNLCFELADLLRKKVDCKTLVIEDLQQILMVNEKLMDFENKSLTANL